MSEETTTSKINSTVSREFEGQNGTRVGARTEALSGVVSLLFNGSESVQLTVDEAEELSKILSEIAAEAR